MKKEIKSLIDKGEMLPLMEEFYTVQGEGFHKGTAAYFIRIGGCDVGCHWCDVKESWNADLHPPTFTEKIVKNASKYSNTVVVTGGEPLIWNMEPLTYMLKKNNLNVPKYFLLQRGYEGNLSRKIKNKKGYEKGKNSNHLLCKFR